MTCFYLPRPREALALTLTMAAVLAFRLIGVVEPLRAAAITVTILLTAAFAFAFSILSNRHRIGF